MVARTITPERLREYAQASGDFNPLHLDPAFAATTQFGGIIAHGMLTLAFVSEMMAAAFGRAWLESGALQIKFTGAAYLGDKLETWGQVTKEEAGPHHRLVVCSVAVRNGQNGQKLISGTATLKLA